MIDSALIRKKRRELDLTQEELAERCELSTGYIGMVERGEFEPPIRSLEKFAKELGLKYADIWKEES